MDNVCSSHDYFQKEIDKIKLDVEILKQNKVNNMEWQTNVKDLQKDIALLSSRLEEVIKDRYEDKELIEEYRTELKSIVATINSTNINNAKIEKGQEDTLRRVGNIEESLSRIEKAFSFSWLDLFNGFINKNIITKLFTWIVGGIIIVLPIFAFVYLLSGKSVLNLLAEVFLK